MLKANYFVGFSLLFLIIFGCNTKKMEKSKNTNIIFLHHSTGNGVWKGSVNKYVYKLSGKGDVEKLLTKYNKKHGVSYSISENNFPKREPYGWKNYPYDYYNIWVKNAGDKPFVEEPTLEMLTKKYEVIIFKHCFPVSNVLEDDSVSSADSEKKTYGNYKLQYEALKQKMHEFPQTKFILWTGAALTKANTTEENAKRAEEFFNWVKYEWNAPDDNIYLWDFREIETEGGLYLKDEYAVNTDNSHPNREFNGKAAKLFIQRIVDVIENDGKNTNLVGNPV